MNTFVKSLGWAYFLFGFVAAAGHAENWPSFRGPNGSGLGSGDPPTTWKVKSGENIKWKTSIPGLVDRSG